MSTNGSGRTKSGFALSADSDMFGEVIYVASPIPSRDYGMSCRMISSVRQIGLQ